VDVDVDVDVDMEGRCGLLGLLQEHTWVGGGTRKEIC